jgi:hypothetical protein
MKEKSNHKKQSHNLKRVIGLDVHPDSFTAAVIRGQTPADAIIEKVFNQVPMAQLQSWANKETSSEDLIVMEASGNSFQVVRQLAALEREALVLESCQMGRLKEAHANNDKISAVRSFKNAESGGSLPPPSSLRCLGRSWRSGCFPAEPYPPERQKKSKTPKK